MRTTPESKRRERAQAKRAAKKPRPPSMAGLAREWDSLPSRVQLAVVSMLIKQEQGLRYSGPEMIPDLPDVLRTAERERGAVLVGTGHFLGMLRRALVARPQSPPFALAK